MDQAADHKTTTQLIREQRLALISRRELAHGVKPGTYASFEWVRRLLPEIRLGVRE